VLLVDNYSSHTAHAVSASQETHPRLRLDYLPKYCSHVNPVERIWLQPKNALAANRLHISVRVLLETVEAFFTALTPEQTLTWAAT
jgi:transposase